MADRNRGGSRPPPASVPVGEKASPKQKAEAAQRRSIVWRSVTDRTALRPIRGPIDLPIGATATRTDRFARLFERLNMLRVRAGNAEWKTRAEWLNYCLDRYGPMPGTQDWRAHERAKRQAAERGAQPPEARGFRLGHRERQKLERWISGKESAPSVEIREWIVAALLDLEREAEGLKPLPRGGWQGNWDGRWVIMWLESGADHVLRRGQRAITARTARRAGAADALAIADALGVVAYDRARRADGPSQLDAASARHWIESATKREKSGRPRVGQPSGPRLTDSGRYDFPPFVWRWLREIEMARAPLAVPGPVEEIIGQRRRRLLGTESEPGRLRRHFSRGEKPSRRR